MARAYVYEDDAAGWRPMVAGDLPNSGVGAGTYGDSTHVGQVTVDAHGLVTAAANVAIAGGGTISSIASPGGTIGVTNPSGPTTDLDLPSSGVVAGSYGSATQVGQFTVSADGIITAASAVAISGGAANITVLFNSVLGGTANKIDTGAGGFSTSFNHLFVVLLARTDEAVVNSLAAFTFNNDTAANYDTQTVRGINVTASATSNVGVNSLGITVPGSTEGASIFGGAFMVIPSYGNTTPHKQMYGYQGWGSSTAANGNVRGLAGHWRNTAAINRIIAQAGTGGASNFIAGTQMTVYGIG